MFNLIKMDLYRLFRSKSTCVMIIMAACMACFSIYMTDLSMDMMKDYPSSAIEDTDTDSDMASFGIFVETNPQWINGEIDAFEVLGAQLNGRMVLILVSVFVILFVTAERKNGFIKNIAGQFHNRSIMVAAKIVAIAVQVFILFVTYAVFTVISSLILWGDRVVFASVTDFLPVLGIQYLLHFAFACFAAFLWLLSDSSALSMTISILLCCNFGSLIYSPINYLIGKSFSIEKYMLETNISFVGGGVIPDVAARAVMVCIIFTLASAAVSMLIVQKRDIK